MNEKKNTKKRTWIIVLAILLAVALLGGGLLARYVSRNRQQTEMISAGFHISSNYLTAAGSEYTVPDWGSGLVVSIFNYELENIAQVSEMDIQYEVNVTNGTLDQVTTGGTTVVQADPDTGYRTIAGGPTKVEHVLHITPSGAGDVTVTVKAVKPYSKELTATLKTVSKQLPTYTFTDRNDGTALLTIKSNDYAGTVSVKWNAAKYSPDNTNEIMKNWTDGGENSSGSFTSDDNATYYLIFVKNTTDSVTAQNGTANVINLG